ncbi:STAS domain-containing protein [Pseudomonas sp. RGM2987]|uniref:STAS domain-containing protein n=1 Tax=Pseudomonas sp. RGM2987 TaxID=2930090 RepID=UPI0032B01201
MSVVTEVSPDGQKLTISIKGRFDFGRHQEFRESYERLNMKPESIVVDLKEATYLDSSALGMLLLLRDHAGGDDSDIRIVNSNSDVKKILAISNFDKLFDIYPKEDKSEKDRAGHHHDRHHSGKA